MIFVLALCYVLISYMFDHAVVNRRLLIFFHLFIFSLIAQIKLFPSLLRPERLVLLRHAFSLRASSLTMSSLFIISSNMILKSLGQLTKQSYITIVSYSLFYFFAITIIYFLKHIYLMRMNDKNSGKLENDLSTFILEMIPYEIIAIVLAKTIPVPYPMKMFLPLIIGPLLISFIIRIYGEVLHKKFKEKMEQETVQ